MKDGKIEILKSFVTPQGLLLTTTPGNAEALAAVFGAIALPGPIIVEDDQTVLIHWAPADLPSEERGSTRQGGGSPMDPLWKTHIADQVAVTVAQQLAEDVAWAEAQGIEADAIRHAAQLCIGSGVRLRDVLEIYRKDREEASRA